MKKLMTMIALAACAAALTGCQTRITIESDETKPLPVQQLVEVDGTNRVITTGYFEGRPHYCITARSPLYAKESVARFAAGVGEKGTWTINADGYSRELSTNAVVMTKTVFDGSANLAIAVAKAYATISTGGATDATGAVVAKVVSFFKSKGGDAAKSTVTSDGTTIKVSDGSTCVECDAAGNCTECTPAK
ncbi:MAG: hypothetical protein IKC14_03790 [Kiritimatiellae bacterium]|nr:hypothetical protein [Kiritimatiellia bacterium]